MYVRNEGGPVRCLIVDDSAAFRDAASTMLERGGMSVVGMATNTSDALHRTRELHPDVVLVDIDLGAENGFDVVEALEQAGPPKPSVILISTHSEQEFADLIADSSAAGFLPKIALSPDAIRSVVELSELRGT
jgi:DNA-binding NarL/FixJ family response regulator